MSFGGAAGLWRMFNAQVGGQIAWLLPLAGGGLLAGLWLTRRAPRIRGRAGWVLFGVWAVVHVVVFSFQQGIFHPYYASALAPAVAALAGGGLVAHVGWARDLVGGRGRAGGRDRAGGVRGARRCSAARRTSRRGCATRSGAAAVAVIGAVALRRPRRSARRRSRRVGRRARVRARRRAGLLQRRDGGPGTERQQRDGRAGERERGAGGGGGRGRRRHGRRRGISRAARRSRSCRPTRARRSTSSLPPARRRPRGSSSPAASPSSRWAASTAATPPHRRPARADGADGELALRLVGGGWAEAPAARPRRRSPPGSRSTAPRSTDAG